MPPLSTFSRTCIAMAIGHACALPAQAATITVNSVADPGIDDTLCTLREAVISSNNDPAVSTSGCVAGNGADTIVFTNGLTSITLNGNELEITDSVTINGNGEDSLEINGADSSRIFQIDDGDNSTNIDVTITDMTLTNGNTGDDVSSYLVYDGYGGGAVRSAENLSLSNVTVSNSSAGRNGGGVAVYHYDQGGTVSLQNITLAGNHADPEQNDYGRGGGLYITSKPTVSSSTVDISLSSLVVSNNTANFEGGGIYKKVIATNGATVTTNLADSMITGNRSLDNDGGGIYLDFSTSSGSSAEVLIDNLDVYSNTTDEEGGGVYLRNFVFDPGSTGSVTIRNSAINDNESLTGNAGGLYINNNSWSDSAATVAVENSTISGNRSEEEGGGAYIRNFVGDPGTPGNVTFLNSSISGNESLTAADGQGGGVYLMGDGETRFENSTIGGNSSAAEGGGIYATLFSDDYHTGVLEIVNSTLSNNQANGRGGGLFVKVADVSTNGGSVVITNSTITENTSDADYDGGAGGGMYLNEGTLSLLNTIIAANTDNSTVAADAFITSGLPYSISHSLIGNQTGITALAEAPVGSPDVQGNLIGGPVTGLIDPVLGPLSDNGGPTFTHRPGANSPVVDNADNNHCPSTDQRGVERNSEGFFTVIKAQNGNVAVLDFSGNGPCDMGSVER